MYIQIYATVLTTLGHDVKSYHLLATIGQYQNKNFSKCRMEK